MVEGLADEEKDSCTLTFACVLKDENMLMFSFRSTSSSSANPNK